VRPDGPGLNLAAAVVVAVFAVAALIASAACGVITEGGAGEPSSVTTLTARPPDGDRTVTPAETVTVTVGNAGPLEVEIAATAQQRQRGLMERDRVPAGTGMIFVFPRAEPGAFWMYRTRVPLSIVWAVGGRVVGVAEMEPCTSADSSRCPTYPSPEPFDLAVEAPAGTFTAAGVRPGDPVRVTGTLPTPPD
jgi:uncharacterized membrane protein (UPF0127 family)